MNEDDKMLGAVMMIASGCILCVASIIILSFRTSDYLEIYSGLSELDLS